MAVTRAERMTPVKRCALVASILGSGIVFLDSTIVNVALPAIRSSLHGGLAEQQWVVEAYLLTLSSLLLVGGSLGDRLGRRRVFSAGLVGFGVCSLRCAIAPTSGVLIAARAAQGVAGALLVPSIARPRTYCVIVKPSSVAFAGYEPNSTFAQGVK